MKAQNFCHIKYTNIIGIIKYQVCLTHSTKKNECLGKRSVPPGIMSLRIMAAINYPF
jgi:hypothetical protein